jgi:hypothetical protein
MVSGFKNKIYLPADSLYPWLQAFENPMFSSLLINFTQGKIGFK